MTGWEGQGASVADEHVGPDFGSGDSHTGQDLVLCHLVLPTESGTPQTHKKREELQSPRAREREEACPGLTAGKPGPQQVGWEGARPAFRLRERFFVAVVSELQQNLSAYTVNSGYPCARLIELG